MAYRKPETNELVGQAEGYLDTLVVPIGFVAVAILVGFLTGGTFGPDYGANGLFAMTGQFFAVNGVSISWAAVIGTSVPAYVLGSNEFVEKLSNRQELRSDEGIATVIGISIPLAFEYLTEAQSFVAGSTGAQAFVVLLYTGAVVYLAEISPRDLGFGR